MSVVQKLYYHLHVSDLTSTRVVYAGTSGSLEDRCNLTFSSNTLNAFSIDVQHIMVQKYAHDVNTVSAASTFGGIIDANHQIVGLATNNIIPFTIQLILTSGDVIPSASNLIMVHHAHVHARGKG